MTLIRFILISCVLGFFLTACEQTADDILNNLIDGIELTESQEMDLVILSLSKPSGGLANIFNVAGNAINPAFYVGKVDTVFNRDWVNYHLELHFFADGGEVSDFMPGVVDSVAAYTDFSGYTTMPSPSQNGAEWEIFLNARTALYVQQVGADSARIAATGQDSSQFVCDHSGITLNIDSRSSFLASDAMLAFSSSDHTPTSGQVNGTIRGTAHRADLQKDVYIPYMAVFIGDDKAVVTLTNSGRQFTVNLRTGEII